MGGWLAVRWQTAVIVLLFAASLAALLFSSSSVLLLPHRELQARDRLRTAATGLAAAAEPLLPDLPAAGAKEVVPEALNRRFAAAAAAVLAGYPDTEGGYYLGELDQFVGFAHPGGPPAAGRRNPPPLEAASVRQQAIDVLARPAGEAPVVEVRDVGPSRVAVATAAAGTDRPARAAAWVMVRLTGPEQQREQLRRALVSVYLALGGILLALLLTAGLTRSLRRERGQRERLRDELRRAEHLAALGKLLAALRSTVQLWQRLPDQARTQESLHAVVAAVDRLNDLVGRLLLFARSGQEERRPVDLNGVVTETLALLRAQAEGQAVRLTADLDPALPAVPGSAQALRQVVLNLATNALQAMPYGGALACRTRPVPAGVELTVADTGPGVAPADRAHLFEPFHTTRPDGTGLGLALCREIVEQHGGRIELAEGVTPGATFRVTLPARSEP
jgi:two-component system, NtrC family, sensor histidine kinase HydH